MKKLLTLAFVLGLFLCVNAENKNEEPINSTINSADCINGRFSHYEDWNCIADLTLTSGCRFTFDNHEESESIVGKYQITNEVTRESSATIYFYSDYGEEIAYGTIYYDSDGKLTVILGDFVLKKRY